MDEPNEELRRAPFLQFDGFTGLGIQILEREDVPVDGLNDVRVVTNSINARASGNVSRLIAPSVCIFNRSSRSGRRTALTTSSS
jgi:hypothetical protein